MIANQDTLLKSAYMNEWYWVVAMNITFNLTVYLKKTQLTPTWPWPQLTPTWPIWAQHYITLQSGVLPTKFGGHRPLLSKLTPADPNMTFDRNNALCYGQGFFSPNLVAIEQKNKTKQKKQTLLQRYHHFHWNREEHEFPKLSPPPRYNIDVAQKICISRTMSLNNIIIQVFRHPKIFPSLMKKFHTPQFHHPLPFQKTTKKNTSLSPYIWYLSIL